MWLSTTAQTLLAKSAQSHLLSPMHQVGSVSTKPPHTLVQPVQQPAFAFVYARRAPLPAAPHHTAGAHTRAAPADLLQLSASSSNSTLEQQPHSHPVMRQHASWLRPLSSNEVWYLSYGSNMNPQVLTGRRRVRPQQSMPCYVPGYTLSFAVQGFPWAEPGFATIEQLPPGGNSSSSSGSDHSSWRRRFCNGSTPCLHGVLHRVTKQEWALIKASEGVMTGNSSVGYQVVEVDCVLCDDRTVLKALTLQASPASLHHAARNAQPSARYLGLLQAGSKHHSLDIHYQLYLDSMRPYKPPSTLQATVGSLAATAVLLSAASSALPVYALSRAVTSSSSRDVPAPQTSPDGDATAPSSSSSNGGSSDTRIADPPKELLSFMRWYTGAASRLVWDVHDSLEPWLGSGSASEERQ